MKAIDWGFVAVVLAAFVVGIVGTNIYMNKVSKSNGPTSGFVETLYERPIEDEKWGPEKVHFTETQEICDMYHVNLKMWSWPDKYIRIAIPDHSYLIVGTDDACQKFGRLCEKILDIYDDGWKLEVEAKWVPSVRQPIDLAWARELAKGY